MIQELISMSLKMSRQDKDLMLDRDSLWVEVLIKALQRAKVLLWETDLVQVALEVKEEEDLKWEVAQEQLIMVEVCSADLLEAQLDYLAKLDRHSEEVSQ